MSGTGPQADTPRVAPSAQSITVALIAKPCPVCKILTKVRVGGRPGHAGCFRRAAAPPAVAAAASAAESELREPAPLEVSMFKLLAESIRTSNRKPILRIAAAERGAEPWSLMTEPMRGEHRFRRAAPDRATIKLFDRNGSYPSAMANVPVAAGPLRRAGAIGYDTGHAGIYKIARFGWDGPHPLGEIADQDTDMWWITTPHLRLCMKLAAQQRIEPVPILDSWTGRSATNLFRQFSADVTELRAQARADSAEAYTEVKRRSSIAIRGLWPKGARSPFWRPDWSLSVRAEASVRHWVKADQASTAGADLIGLGSVDEVAFIQPPRARSSWVPEPYKLGEAFGEVKAKATMPAAEWNRKVSRG